MKIFTIIYFLLALVLYIGALPFLILFSFKKKYTQSLPARFFLYKNSPFKKNDLWFHACSLGEVRALKPILELFSKKELAISTTTQTGFSEAKKYPVQSRYLPFELFLPFWIRSSKVVVVLEAEFWYLLFAVVKSKGATLVLLNARISTKSYPKYQKMAWFYRRIFSYVDMVFVQSDDDRARFLSLGALNVEVSGNIKLAQKIEHSEQYPKSDTETFVAASTHEGEEILIFEAFKVLRTHRNAKLIVVPRHPERFELVWALIREQFSQDFTLARWSEEKNFEADILLLDAMGELNNIYNICDTAILGGAFKEDVGGHNPLEPAHFGCKIISGEHYFNQRELFKYVTHLSVVKNEELSAALITSENLSPCVVNEKIDLEKVERYINEKLEK